MADISKYLKLITSEHADKPKYIATISLFAQEFADDIELVNTLSTLFDIDTAVGVQLDAVGQWIGVSRYLETALQSVYFAWDIIDLGWDKGIWKGPFDPSVGLTRLDDDHYRILLKARIVANRWDGSIPNAYEVWDTVFANEGFSIFLQDGSPAYIAEFRFDDQQFTGWDYGAWSPAEGWNGFRVTGGMSIIMGLIAPPVQQPPPLVYFAWDDADSGWDNSWWDITPQPFVGPNIDAVTLALFNGGYLDLRPAGVSTYHVTQSVAGSSIFAWDTPTTAQGTLAGWDVGAWGNVT